jgi:hypothetical protein
MSIISLVLAFVFPVAGIVTSILAQKEIQASNGTKGGASLAKSAFLISIIVLALEVIVVTLWSVNYFQVLNDYNNQISDLQDEIDDAQVPQTCWDPFWEEYVDC